MQGVNLPVAPVGQEAIFRKVYLELGLSEEDIEGYFTGPAYLANVDTMVLLHPPLSL